jgi:hypothetical protein
MWQLLARSHQLGLVTRREGDDAIEELRDHRV